MRALPLRAQGVEGVIEARAKPAGLVGIGLGRAHQRFGNRLDPFYTRRAAGTGVDDAAVGEFGVRLGHGSRRDAQIVGKLTDRRQTVSVMQRADPNHAFDLSADLLIHRCRRRFANHQPQLVATVHDRPRTFRAASAPSTGEPSPESAYQIGTPGRYPIEQLLIPIEGTAYYIGATWLKPFATYGAFGITDEALAQSAAQYKALLAE
ncbi:glutathione-regulated potassium-efflux system ancillary protein KefG [Bifidobacterium longum]|uniref:Glutathione-regulated potassium-efflux system ancillary protein KefG n=2 Tax=Bifidobacterium longum TaxID=216816 RepID=A0A6N2UEZ0_BIFLN